MLRGWRRRAERQADSSASCRRCPTPSERPSSRATKGLYVGSTLAPSWQDRIAVGDLGFRDQGGADPLPRGNHAAAQRRVTRSGFPTTRSPRSAPNAESPARPSPTRASWRSGGGCRRAPRSTPDSGPTTARAYAQWVDRQEGSSVTAMQQPGRTGPGRRACLHRHHVRGGRRRPSARRCSRTGCRATRRH